MKHLYKHLRTLTVLSLAIFISSCSKDSQTYQITDPTLFKGNIVDLYTNLKKDIPSQTFTISSETDNLLTTNTGIRVNIPSNSFQTIKSPYDKISGDVNVTITVLNKKADWVRYAQYSNISGYVINWYKTVSVSVTKNGTLVKLINGKQITVQMPEDNPSVNWKMLECDYLEPRDFRVVNNTNTYKLTSWEENGATKKGLEFSISNNLLWFGFGTLNFNSTLYQLQVNLPDNYRKFNTAVIVSNPTDNIVYYLNNLNVVSSSYKEYLHTNKDLSVLVISDQGDNTYYGSKDYYPELTEFEQDKVPAKRSYLEIQEYINGL